MNLFDLINLGTIGTTCWCAAFAATNFGNKFGRLWGFQNTLGYKYISDEDSDKADKYYEQIAKMYEKDEKVEAWVKDKDKLKERCNNYQYSLRYWGDTVKYCVIQKNVRHKLVELGLDIKTPDKKSGDGCTEDLLNSFSDELSLLIGRKECGKEPIKASAAK